MWLSTFVCEFVSVGFWGSRGLQGWEAVFEATAPASGGGRALMKLRLKIRVGGGASLKLKLKLRVGKGVSLKLRLQHRVGERRP